MGVLAECPICRKKQSVRNKKCACGEDLDKAKRGGRVRYWIDFRVPGGRQRREVVGYSLEDAKAADGKRRGQKKEGRIFDMLPESKITFTELSEWYTGLSSVRRLASFPRVEICLNHFNGVFGNRLVGDLKAVDLDDYQAKRTDQGIAAATVDMELSIVKTMVQRATDNDLLDGRALKPFRRVQRQLRKGSNARHRVLTFDELGRLLAAATGHLRAVVVIGINTGMRLGEIRTLRWSYIDRDAGFIRLPAEATKERRVKSIPINIHVQEAIEALPRAIQHDYIITYRGNPISQPGGLHKAFYRACDDAGVPHGRKAADGITFHDIRRTVKTGMVEAGVDKVYRDLMLGHALPGMDARYLAPGDDMLRAAMGRYTEWLDEKISWSTFGQQIPKSIY